MATTILQGRWTAERVQELRLRLTLSIEEFAKVIDVTRRSVSGWEQGRWVPAHYRVIRALDALDAETRREA